MEQSTSMRMLTLRLIDGKPDGMLQVEEKNWNVSVLQTSRNDIVTKKLHSRPEAERPGVYILLGEKVPEPIAEEKESEPTAYVGETDNQIIVRLNQHIVEKDWWEKAILITSQPNYLNKAHVLYLEARLLKIIKKAGNVRLENVQEPDPRISGDDELEMNRFLDALLVILTTLHGDMFLKKPTRQENEEKPRDEASSSTRITFELRSDRLGYNARMVLDGSDYIVLADSLARKWQGDKHATDGKRIDELKNKGILESTDEGMLRFTEDYAFKSPSKAARVVTGRNANGRTEWLIEGSDQSLRQWEEEQARR